MEIKTKDDKIVEVKIGGSWVPLRNFPMKDLAKLQENVDFFAEYMYSAEDGYPWSDEELKKFISESSTMGIKLIKQLIKNYPEKVKAKKLAEALGEQRSQVVAGLLAGFTRRIKRDFQNKEKEKLILSEWNEGAWAMEYKINAGYINKLRSLLPT